METFYVYTHTRPDTGKIFYIGKGHRYRSSSKVGRSKLWNSIVNKNNGEFLINYPAIGITEKEAHELEIKLISKYGRIDKKTGSLANHTDGGEGVFGITFPEEELLRRKIFARDNHPFKGKHHSEKSKKIMRIKKLGKPSNWKGKSPSEETREKMRKAKLGKPSGRKGKEGFNKKRIIDTTTGEVVALGTKDFIAKGLGRDRKYKTLVNYFSGWKKKPVWFTYSNS